MRKFLLGVTVLLLAGCASTSLPPVTATDYKLLPDEKRLWLQAGTEQQKLTDSGLLFADAGLEAYLNRVARTLVPASAREKIPFRIKVIKNPYTNAFAYPNGKVYVHTGILARMDNEAQLATLLAHEMAHATHRHAIRQRRGFLNKSAFLASMQATVGTLPVAGELSNVMGELGTRAAISGYSRELETEADMVGLERIVAAGYDPQEAPELFEHLLKAAEEEEKKEPFFFSSHPKLKVRIQNYNQALARLTAPAGGKIKRKRFENHIAKSLLATAKLDLRAGRFAKARRELERYLTIRPKDARGPYLLGEMFRQRGGEKDFRSAKEHFRNAVTLAPDMAKPYRSIALIYLKEGNKRRAKANFQAYLDRAPRAGDRAFVHSYIEQCR